MGLGKIRKYGQRNRIDRWGRMHRHGWAGHTRDLKGRQRLGRKGLRHIPVAVEKTNANV